jgi:hypothetical protein
MSKYTDRITTLHGDKPGFVSMVEQITNQLIGVQNLYSNMVAYYDLDTAVGAQLDVIGLWIGISRDLSAPVSNVYYSFDIANLGFDNGVWRGPYDPASGIITLPDEYYRLVLKAKILNNHWDGTKEQAYSVVQAIFEPYGFLFFIEDNADLSMDIGLLTGESQNSLIVGLLKQGKFNIKPAGIRINYYISASDPGKIFSFDFEATQTYFGGFDNSSWATLTDAASGVSSDALSVILIGVDSTLVLTALAPTVNKGVTLVGIDNQQTNTSTSNSIIIG